MDTEYADYLISLILASPSASTKTLITKIISFYYKENKTLNQIASEVNRSYNHTFTLKNRGLAIIVRLLRKTGSSDSIDEMGRIITTNNEEDTQMKAHKYWSLGALACMAGCFYTGCKKLMQAHKYFACGSLVCMGMAIYSGHKIVPKKKKAEKPEK